MYLQASTETLFGHSWRHGNDTDPDCKWDCDAVDPACTDPVAKKQAIQLCSVLSDRKGKFKVRSKSVHKPLLHDFISEISFTKS